MSVCLRVTLAAAVLSAMLIAVAHADGGPRAPFSADSPYTTQAPRRGGIGKVYMGREISEVMGHRGAAWLERPSRVLEEWPAKVVERMELEPDHVVADLGAGTGYFTFRISPRVPLGRVFAVDIQQEMLDIIRERMARQGSHNVTPVLGTSTDPKLAPNSIDVVLLVDAYHEFSHPYETMTAVVKALKPGGRVYLVEYRAEDYTVPIKRLHKMSAAQARMEMEAVGLRWIKTLGFLPTQHFMVFEKPGNLPTTNPTARQPNVEPTSTTQSSRLAGNARHPARIRAARWQATCVVDAPPEQRLLEFLQAAPRAGSTLMR